jgi:hypothetical protein
MAWCLIKKKAQGHLDLLPLRFWEVVSGANFCCKISYFPFCERWISINLPTTVLIFVFVLPVRISYLDICFTVNNLCQENA